MSWEPVESSEEPLAPELPETDCWRCGLVVPDAAAKCPHCQAPLELPLSRGVASRRDTLQPRDPTGPLIISFVLLLVTGIIHSFVLSARFGEVEELDDATRRLVLEQILVVELIDSVIVVAVIGICGGAPRLEPPPTGRVVVTWLAALPLLAAALGLNYEYHKILREFLQVPLLADEVMNQFDTLALLTMCIQPALIEELYCRGFAMGTLQHYVSPRAAIMISAVMFGLMHVSAFASIPLLIVLGVALGYLRWGSGGLLLPILFHFFHNLFILLWP